MIFKMAARATQDNNEPKTSSDISKSNHETHTGLKEPILTVFNEAPATESSETVPSQPKSAFTTRQKRWIVFIAASAGWFSTASSFIYFPIIPFLAQDLNVSVEKINLTVTSYLVVSGIFPTILGSVADHYGRRPILIACISLYVAVNVGLALQRSFAVLVTLRMLQSIAISGESNDWTSILQSKDKANSNSYVLLRVRISRRHYYPGQQRCLRRPNVVLVGYRSCHSTFCSISDRLLTRNSVNTPPSVAPLISGLLLIGWTWPTVFWFLCISSAVVLIAVVLFLPETCRRLVGDGSIRGNTWVTSAPVPFLMAEKSRNSAEAPSQDAVASRLDEFKRVINPLAAAISLDKKRGTWLAVACYGVFYTMYSCTQASLSTIFVEIYGVSGLVAGVSYIPFGVGSVTASTITGECLNPPR